MKIPVIRTNQTVSPILRIKHDACPYDAVCRCWIPSTGVLVSDLLSGDGEHPHDEWEDDEHWPYCRR